MSCGLFIRSYRGDREWLRYCLRSLKKHATFDDIVVVLPYGDEPHFDRFDFSPARVAWWNPVVADGYVDQMANKCYADQYLNTDQIVFADSDTVAVSPFNASILGGAKPIQLIRRWDSVGDAVVWRDCTWDALGFEPRFEHMASHPMCYHRETFGGLRAHIEIVQKKAFVDFFRGIQSRRVSEFNLLGAYAHQFMPHRYDWRLADPATDGLPRCLVQYWSYAGVEKHIPELEALLNA